MIPFVNLNNPLPTTPGTGLTAGQEAQLATAARRQPVTTIAALKALTPSAGDAVNVLGYAAPGDGGGGQFYYDAAASAADNGGTVIAPTAGSGRWLRAYSGAVNVRWFGAKGDGVTDDTASLAAARAWLAGAIGRKLNFPNGTYVYSVSPNWAIHHSEVTFDGHVVLKYTGTGRAVFFDAEAGDAVVHIANLCYSFCWGWGNRPTIEGSSTSSDGIYVRSCHHAKIGARVRGCGPTYAGMRVLFAVCTEFDVVVSGNQDGWVSGATPYYGYWLDRSAPGKPTSYCTFVNPIVEGVTVGIHCERTLGNTFFGGTSEACSQYGLTRSAYALQDKFYGTDFEVNTIADVYDLGVGLVLDQCDTYYKCIFGVTAKRAKLIGGEHSLVLFDTGSLDCVGRDFIYNRFNDGSTMQDAGTGGTMSNIKNLGTGGKYLVGTAASGGVVGMAAGTSTTISVTVVGCRLGDMAVASYSVAITGFTVDANVSSDGFVKAIFTNISGGVASLPAGTVTATALRAI